MVEYEHLDVMTRDFLICALWTASCNGQAQHNDCRGEDCDASLWDLGYAPIGLPTYSHEQARRVCNDFVTLVRTYRPDVLENLDPGQIGHDLWLTACGHGTGFWDRGLGEVGDYLTRHAKSYSFEDPYIGDDGHPQWDY